MDRGVEVAMVGRRIKWMVVEVPLVRELVRAHLFVVESEFVASVMMVILVIVCSMVVWPIIRMSLDVIHVGVSFGRVSCGIVLMIIFVSVSVILRCVCGNYDAVCSHSVRVSQLVVGRV